MHTLRQSYHTRICLDHFICTEKAIKFITGLEKLCQRSNLKVSQLCSQKVLIEWTAFIQGFPNQWPLKIHAHIQTPTAVSTTQGDSQLVGSQGEVSCSGTPRH
jgi:hypothetical protein